MLTFKRSFSKKMGKTASSHIIHSLGGEYCWILRDSEPIRLLKSPRSVSVYTNYFYPVVPRENSKVGITIFSCSDCFLWSSRAWTWWRFKQSIEMCGLLRDKTLITSPKKTLVKYTYPAPRFPLCPIIFSLDQPQPPTGDCGTWLHHISQTKLLKNAIGYSWRRWSFK